MSSPLCSFPWAHLDIETNGDIKYCCASVYESAYAFTDENGDHYNVNTHNIADAWNSDRIRELRRKLYNGIKAPECKVCWQQEALGHWSVRNAAKAAENDCYPDIQKTIDISAKNDFYVEGYPKYYQVQTGNMCNLACKMCHSDYSTTYGDFYVELYPDDVNQYKYTNFDKLNAKNRSAKPKRYDWPIKIGLKNLIDNEKLEHITRLYLSGGEPTIIVENLNFLEYLVTSGHSKHIHLLITTNATKINPRFAESIKHFQAVSLLLSIDAVGDPVEIQRYPVRWSQLKRNLDRYIEIKKENENIGVSLNTVLSYLTLPFVDQLIDLIGSYNKLLGNSALVTLNYGDLSLQNMPLEIAEMCARNLEDALERNSKKLTTEVKNNVVDLIAFLKNFPYNHENDYTKIHTALDIMQQHHPDRDIKSIFSVYFK